MNSVNVDSVLNTGPDRGPNRGRANNAPCGATGLCATRFRAEPAHAKPILRKPRLPGAG